MGANWKRIKDKDLGSSVSNEDGATKLISERTGTATSAKLGEATPSVFV